MLARMQKPDPSVSHPLQPKPKAGQNPPEIRGQERPDQPQAPFCTKRQEKGCDTNLSQSGPETRYIHRHLALTQFVQALP